MGGSRTGWPAPVLNAWPNFMDNATFKANFDIYQRDVINASRCLDDTAELRVCDRCTRDYYGRPGQNLCKDCQEESENEV